MLKVDMALDGGACTRAVKQASKIFKPCIKERRESSRK